MSQVIEPIAYQRLLDMRQTEQGIKLIKEFFQTNLSTELRLRRVTAPLFVLNTSAGGKASFRLKERWKEV